VSANLGQRSAQTTVTLAARDVRRAATVVGSIVRTTFPTSEVWVHPNGKVAYLGTHLGGDRVYTIDINDPAKPTIVDSVIVNARVINDVMTSEDGKIMVITREGADDRKNGLVVATLDDPLHPKVVGAFTDASRPASTRHSSTRSRNLVGTCISRTTARARSTSSTSMIRASEAGGALEDNRVPMRDGCSTTSTCATACSTEVGGTTDW
jgi:hypothetical protein